MSDPRSGDQGIAQGRNVTHDGIVTDQTPDERYANGMNNATKTKFVCNVIRYPEQAFDLDLPFPVEDWIDSEDNTIVCAGLYLSDMRVQFYEKRLEEIGEERGSVWVRHAEAEYWQMKFNELVLRRFNNQVAVDSRVKH